MKSFTSLATRTTIAALLFWIVAPLSAQSVQSYIYGTLHTRSGDSYEGFMRWGKEELFWHDIFNSTKTDDQSNYRRPEKKSGRWFDFDWNFSSIWDNKYGGTSHTFACHFGDIKTLELKRSQTVLVGLKNGSIIEVRGGSNDIGESIYLNSPDLGEIKIPWDRIDQIDFSAAPLHYEAPYETMLYGTVETTRNRTFKGVVTWDMDERIGSDILDGDSREGEHEIPFSLIKSITRSGDGSNVELRSGKELRLEGSNDVDDGNRGVVVFDANYNNIKIDWDDFQKVTFESIGDVIPTYDDYKVPTGIEAEVMGFDGARYKGLVAFDIDEFWELEFLDGNDDQIEYQIPFRNIKRLVPKNRSYSMVFLRDGESLLLGDSQDVSSRNDGLLIFQEGEKEPIHVKWDDIDEIIFK